MIVYKNLIWNLLHRNAVRVDNMSREEMRDALQWCIAHHCQDNGVFIKDGLSTQQWEAIFVTNLLNPELK